MNAYRCRRIGDVYIFLPDDKRATNKVLTQETPNFYQMYY